MSRHSGKIYFFPAVLPLLAVVPWLLTAFGTLAGFVAGLLAKKSRRKIFVSLLALSFACLGAAAYLFWPKATLRYVDQGSRLRPIENLPTLHTLGSLQGETEPPLMPHAAWDTWKPLWEHSQERRFLSDPLVAHGMAIVGTWEGTVEAFSLASGKPLWSVKKNEPVIALTTEGSLLLAGEGVHTSEISALTAMELPSGKVLWSREFQGHLESPATITADRIYLGAGPAGFYCLRASDGEVIWKRPGIHVDSTPLLHGGQVFFSAQEDESKPESVFLALRADDGTEAWRVPIPGQPWGSPTLDPKNKQILITSGIGQIGLLKETDKGWAHAVSLEGRVLKWSRPLPGNPLESSLFLPGAGLVIITVTKGEILALRAESGVTAWSQPLGQPIAAQPDLDHAQQPPRLVSLATDGKLRIQSALTGAFLDEHLFDPGADSSPRFLHDGMLIAMPRKLARYRW